MTFYEKSLLAVEWTTQHGCGDNPKLVCNLIIQYMCSAADANPYDLVRDGKPPTPSPTMPTDQLLKEPLDCSTECTKTGLTTETAKPETEIWDFTSPTEKMKEV
jgi:hypothetical protein